MDAVGFAAKSNTLKVRTMKGLQILLQSLGIHIDPAEIEGAWARTKDAIPKLAAAVEQNNLRLAAIDEKLAAIERRINRAWGAEPSDEVQEVNHHA